MMMIRVIGNVIVLQATFPLDFKEEVVHTFINIRVIRVPRLCSINIALEKNLYSDLKILASKLNVAKLKNSLVIQELLFPAVKP